MSNKRRAARAQRNAEQETERADAAAAPEAKGDVPVDERAEPVDEIVASVEAADEAGLAAEHEASGEPEAAGEDAASDGTVEGDEADSDEEDLDGEDSLTFSNGVIEKIVALAMRDVPGVIGMKGGWLNRVQDVIGVSDSRKGVSVEVTPDASVRVNISVLIEYGAYAPQVFEDVKKAVVKQVTGMTGLAVAGVNLRIEDVLTPEEAAATRKVAARQQAEAVEQAAEELEGLSPEAAAGDAEEGPDQTGQEE